MKYWQVGSGQLERCYTEECLKYGVACVPPDDTNKGRIQSVRSGDRILLRQGLNIVAVGEVEARDGTCSGVGNKPWLRDLDGWDMSAYCNVRWFKPAKPIPVHRMRGAICSAERLKPMAEEVLRACAQPEPRIEEPSPTTLVTDDEILGALVNHGLRPPVAGVIAALDRLRSLASYYYSSVQWKDVREHEIRTFLVVPLLLALGWDERQLKIEFPISGRRRLDLACFAAHYRLDGKCASGSQGCIPVIETKAFDKGLNAAPAQARAYAVDVPSCRCFVVSNGYCYKMFGRNADGELSATPSAYVNLLQPQDRYPLDPINVAGALEAMRCLLPL